MTDQSITIDQTEFPVIVYKNLRVITTELLAQAFGTDKVRIRQNYSNNKDRFIEGKHFFKIVGDELKEFASSLKILTNFSKVRSLILWTDRGAARHAKMLETDAAWDMFEKMEDCYFGTVQTQYGLKQLPTLPAPRAKKAIPGGLMLDQQDAINDLIKERMMTVQKERRAAMTIRIYSAINTKFGTKNMKDGYKNIDPGHFDNIISLIARLPLDEKCYLTFSEEEFEQRVKAIEGELLPKQEAVPTDTITISLNQGVKMMVIGFNGTADTEQNYLVSVNSGHVNIQERSERLMVEIMKDQGYLVAKKDELNIGNMVLEHIPARLLPIMIEVAGQRLGRIEAGKLQA